MAIVYYAFIPRENYNVFRHILPDLPETYEKWVASQERKKKNDRREYAAAKDGSFEARNVLVSGAKFKRYCEEKKEPPTLSMLVRFVNDSTRDHSWRLHGRLGPSASPGVAKAR
jgi:hypothetical protein